MKLRQFIIWTSHRSVPAILFVAVFLLLLAIQFSIERINHPVILHTISSTDISVEEIWVKYDLSSQMATSEGMLFVVPSARDMLIAYDLMTGTIVWETNRPYSRPGARGMAVYKNMVFVVNSKAVDAYNITSGELIWTTFLGDGHVSVILQVEGNILRVYYGEDIYEIDPLIGSILSKSYQKNVLWITGDILIRNPAECKAEAIDGRTGKLIWEQCDIFTVGEGMEPQTITDNTLATNMPNDWICSLNLENGKQNWCSRGMYISNIAIDLKSKQIYALQENFSLVVIDAITGATLKEIKFSTNIENNEYTYGKVIYSNGIVVIYFVDSGQTFAIAIE